MALAASMTFPVSPPSLYNGCSQQIDCLLFPRVSNRLIITFCDGSYSVALLIVEKL